MHTKIAYSCTTHIRVFVCNLTDAWQSVAHTPWPTSHWCSIKLKLRFLLFHSTERWILQFHLHWVVAANDIVAAAISYVVVVIATTHTLSFALHRTDCCILCGALRMAAVRSVSWLVFLLIKTVCFCFCVRLHTVILLHSSSCIHTYSYMLPDSVFTLVHFGFGPFVSSTVCSQSTPWNFASFHRMACVIGPHIPLFLVILVAFHGLCSKRSGFLCPFLLLIIWNVHMMFLHSMSVSVYIYM